jgi:hypothetical protein
MAILVSIQRGPPFLSGSDLPRPGYPPADHEFREFFARQPYVAEGPDAYFQRACAFLTALFVKALEFLEKLAPQSRREAAEKLHAVMANGMTFYRHGAQRVNFTKDVVKLADELVRRQQKPAFVI